MKTGTIRLSSLSLSNDSLEGKHVRKVFKRLADKDKDLLPQEYINYLELLIASDEYRYDGFGFCLSKKDDLLSQWILYADKGAGVAIGFSRGFIEWLASKQGLRVVDVLYDEDKQAAEVKPIYDEIKKQIKEGALQSDGLGHNEDKKQWNTQAGIRDIQKRMLKREATKTKHYNLRRALSIEVVEKLFLLKSPGFFQEEECRLLKILSKDDEEEYLYLPKSNCLRPYREYGLCKQEHHPIDKVILGPKHKTSEKVIQKFLKQNNFVKQNDFGDIYDVEVIPSEVPYQ